MSPLHRSKALGAAQLRRWPLPLPHDGDKDDRGATLVIAGAKEMPGAAILCAESALRAGAGKLQIATDGVIAPYVGAAVPEALVTTFDEAPAYAQHADSVVLGPGMTDEKRCARLIARVATVARKGLVLDAAALAALGAAAGAFETHAAAAVLTPHAGEMASLLGVRKATVERDPARFAARAAARFRAVVALKGAQTYVAAPDGTLYCHTGGTVGLATSGSGDTLAGIIGGLLARGVEPLGAACWAVVVHARAGEALMKKTGVGFLARELLAEFPRLLSRLSASRGRTG